MSDIARECLARETDLLEYLNALEPQDLLAWACDTHGERAAIITSFQNTGCVMIDMARTVAPSLRVVTVDTLRLHAETYRHMDEIEQRYGIVIERFQPEPQRVDEMVKKYGEYLFFDSQSMQEYCCHVRKVEPNKRALATVDVWITGLRKDQSQQRRSVDRASFTMQDGRKVLKLAPLVDWTEEQVQAYVRDHDVPSNPLYDQGYTSIGCIICTTPTMPWEDKRAGRWRWFNGLDSHQKECGIHTSGSGI